MRQLRILTISLMVMMVLAAAISPVTIALAAPVYDEDVEDGDTEIEVEDDDEIEEGDEVENYFCLEGTEDQHPVAAGIAELYEVEYEDVMAMFCEVREVEEGEEDDAGFGFGQIMLAYSTVEKGADLEDLEGDFSLEGLLGMRSEGMGWGQIWQEMGLIGKPDDAGKPDGVGKPDHAGPPPWAGGADKGEGKEQ